MDFTETQKSRYLEKETLFFFSNKKHSLIAHPGLLYGKNSLVAELTYKIKGFDTIAAKIKSIS